MVWTLVASLLGALGGAWAGAYFGVRQFKEERVIELRMEWYLDAIRSLHRASSQINSAAIAAKKPAPAKMILEIMEGAQDGFREVRRISQESWMFASRNSMRILREAVERTNEIDPSQASTGLVARMSSAADQFQRAARAIARDGREYANLESVDDLHAEWFNEHEE